MKSTQTKPPAHSSDQPNAQPPAAQTASPKIASPKTVSTQTPAPKTPVGQALQPYSAKPHAQENFQVCPRPIRLGEIVDALRTGGLLAADSFDESQWADQNGASETLLRGICHDTNLISPGFLFVCVPGQRADGAFLCAKAIEAGARVVVVQQDHLQQNPVQQNHLQPDHLTDQANSSIEHPKRGKEGQTGGAKLGAAAHSNHSTLSLHSAL
jgi:hypothetical protein